MAPPLEDKINASILPATIITLEGIPTQVDTLLPFLLTLTMEDRRKKRKMGAARTGYVASVYAGINAHKDDIPDNYDLNAFTKDKEMGEIFPYVINIFKTIVEKLTDTDIQLRHEMIKQADIGYRHLQTAALSNSEVKDTVDMISAAYLGRGKKKTVAESSIAKEQQIIVTGTVPETLFINSCTTVLAVDGGPELAGGVRQPTMHVMPSNSYKLPKGYTSIKITNESADTVGAYLVKTK